MSGNVIARSLLAAGFTLAVICGCSEQSTSNATSKSSPATKSPTATPAAIDSSSAVRAYIDPKTGALRDPTPEELAAEAAAEAQRKQPAAANHQAERPVSREVITPSGAVEVTLDPSTQRPLKGCIAKNGDIKMDHECPTDLKSDNSRGDKK